MTQGSYTFDTFQSEQQQQELTRLQRKTKILHALDQQAWHQAALSPGMHALDLGCGTGALTVKLAKTLCPGSVVGVDASIEMVEHAIAKQSHHQIDNVQFVIGNAYNLTFPDATFDVVYARFLLQHLTEPIRALKEAYRVLKPGGRLCIIDIDDDWFSLYPEPDALTTFREQVVAIQQGQGGDPYVGRKLSVYGRQAGFENAISSVQVLTTDEYGAETLFGLLSFGAPYHASHPDFARIAADAKQQLYRQLTLTDVWASFGIFVTTCHKSER
ncbi:MAG: methyltransferase domain-containing protein [Cyanobacteria bacterium P01_D01_bin.44]